jgi:FAD/FMN-containing dehydrogenase
MAVKDMSDLPQLGGDIIVPDYSKPVHESVSRWSFTGIIDRPALTIIPNTEEDILEAIDYAKTHTLQVLPVGGGHGSLAPITSKTLYLDLKKFNKVEVDSDNQTVTVGGGAVTSQLIKACTEHRFYTTWPNSNAVGVVGCILGGGNVSRRLLLIVQRELYF